MLACGRKWARALSRYVSEYARVSGRVWGEGGGGIVHTEKDGVRGVVLRWGVLVGGVEVGVAVVSVEMR